MVLKARPLSSSERQSPFAPAPIEEVEASIASFKPDVVFAPHVETASGILLPDSYLRRVADAVHANGGLFVLDCIASGALWVDMAASGVDILISAPQKGWSAPASCALVMLNQTARERIDSTSSTSFACDLRRWLQIMESYENGGFAYHTTMPTDSLVALCKAMKEARAVGFEQLRQRQQRLGDEARAMLTNRAIRSVAAPGFQAPTVVVSYTDDVDVQNGKKFAATGLQIAAGVPLQCDESAEFRTFRLGLFGLDKLQNIERTLQYLDEALSRVILSSKH
jgi:aspartate aminotransferase-like enzyme